jgi:hypothetical protein
LAASAALCTWRARLNMSGASLASIRVAGAILAASAWATALSRIAERFSSMRTIMGMEAS